MRRPNGSFWRVLGLYAFLVVITGSLLQATPPRTAWATLEERAEAEGAGAVRGEYAARLAEFESFVRKTPPPATPDEFVQRAMAIGGIFQFGSSWTFVEARALLRGATLDAGGVEACESLVRLTGLAAREFDSLKTTAPAMESRVTPDHLAKYGPFIKNVGTLSGNRDQLSWRLAVLGGVAGDESLLGRVFDAAGGMVRSDAREYASVSEFIDNPPDFGVALGLPPVNPAPSKSRKRSAGPESGGVQNGPEVSEERKEMARRVITELYAAMAEKDSKRIASLFQGRSGGHARASRMDEAGIVAIELGEAQFEFYGVGEEMVDVVVSGIRMVVNRDGERVEGTGRKSFRVVFAGDQALIVGPGGRP